MYGADLPSTSTSTGPKSNEPKVFVQLGPTTRSLAVKKLSEAVNEETTAADGHIEGKSDGIVGADKEHDPKPSCSDHPSTEEEIKLFPRKNHLWSLPEIEKFYQGLKEYGKNFEQISHFMSRFKLKRDKYQIQKYYFNSFKVFRAMTKITEEEFANIPRDAKELFIIINGCEWRFKTSGMKVCQDSFRQLILTGATTVKVKNKKVVLRTPTCKALRQFFRYDEKFANIPRQLGIRLSPNSYKDKDYVISCEQNPYLFVKMDMNDSLNSVFDLLEKKWISRDSQALPLKDAIIPKFKLVITKTTVFPKLIVRSLDESQRRMCLNNLMKYVKERMEAKETREEEEQQAEAKEPGLASPTSSNQGLHYRKKSKGTAGPSCVIIDSNSYNEFVFRHDLLSEGFQKDTVHNVSGLHLYLITGMQPELNFTYKILNQSKPAPSIWDLFVSFTKRDYLWYGTDYMVHGTTNAFRKRKKQQQAKLAAALPPSVAETQPEELPGSEPTIVQDEMLGFLEQWNSLSKTTATLNQPEPEIDSNAAASAVIVSSLPLTVPTPTTVSSPSTSIPIAQSNVTFARPSMVIAKSRSHFPRKRKAADYSTSHLKPTSTPGPSVPSRPVDFSFLNPEGASIQPSTSESAPLPTCDQASTSSTLMLDRTIDGASLQRALTDEFSNQLGLMAQQNSIDYCRQFEDFVNYFQSPQKTSKLQ